MKVDSFEYKNSVNQMWLAELFILSTRASQTFWWSALRALGLQLSKTPHWIGK